MNRSLILVAVNVAVFAAVAVFAWWYGKRVSFRSLRAASVPAAAEGDGAHPAGSGAVHGAVETTQGVPRPTREYGSYRITVRDGEPFRIGSAGDGMAERVTRYSSALSLIAVQGCESSPVCRLGSEAQTKWCDACIATDALRQPVPISPAAERRRLAEQIEAMTYGNEVQW